MPFQKAVRSQIKLRMSIAGPSGSGKTWTALTLATALAGEKGVAVIDTERGSASKYADVFSFDVIELYTYHPDLFVQAIHEAEEGGYGVLVIDSLSHAWNGTGGLLEIVDTIAARKYQKNTFAAWKDATPIQNVLIDALTKTPLHLIVTMRSKQEYALEKDERTGKTQPKKLGMAPIQRDGMEYEMDIAVDMDIDNTMIVQKSRCSALSGQVFSKPGKQVATLLHTWLTDGSPVEPQQSRPRSQQTSTPHIIASASEHDTAKSDPLTPSQLRKECQDIYGVDKWEAVLVRLGLATKSDEDLTPADCKKIGDALATVRAKRQQAA